MGSCIKNRPNSLHFYSCFLLFFCRAGLSLISKFLACALGCLAYSPRYVNESPGEDDEDESLHTTGDLFYQEALKTIALPADAVLAAQCWFFSGVYNMYKLKPTNAWMDFVRASSALSLRLQHKKSLSEDSQVLRLDPDELRLYWTCWKSEW